MNILNEKNILNKKGSEVIKTLKKTILLVFVLVSGVFCREANSSLASCLDCLHLVSRSINTIDRTATRVEAILSEENVKQTFNNMKTNLGKDLLEYFNIDLSKLNLKGKSKVNIKEMTRDKITNMLEREADQIISKCFDALTQKLTSLESGNISANIDSEPINNALTCIAPIIAGVSRLCAPSTSKKSETLLEDPELIQAITFSTLEYILKPLLSSMRNLATDEDYTAQIQTLYALIAEMDYNNEAAINKFKQARVEDAAVSNSFMMLHTLSASIQQRASALVSVIRAMHSAPMNIRSPRTAVTQLLETPRAAQEVNSLEEISVALPTNNTVETL